MIRPGLAGCASLDPGLMIRGCSTFGASAAFGVSVLGGSVFGVSGFGTAATFGASGVLGVSAVLGASALGISALGVVPSAVPAPVCGPCSGLGALCSCGQAAAG